MAKDRPTERRAAAAAAGRGARGRDIPVRGKVSIVIPCLDAAGYIGPCVESALGQTYPDTEVVVVDAGSTDGTLDILRRYGGRVRVVRDDGGSIPHSLNAAIERMEGEWLRRVDSDDVIMPDAVEALVAASDPSDPGSAIPYGDYSRIDGRGADTGVVYRFPYNRLSAFEQGVRQIDHIFASSTSCLIHRAVFERAGMFDEGFEVAEDREFALRCTLLHGIRFVNVPRVLYGYRVRDGQLTADRARIHAEADRAVRHVLSRLPVAERSRYERAAREYGRLHGFLFGVWSHANGADMPPERVVGDRYQRQTGAAGGGGASASVPSVPADAAVRATYESLWDRREHQRGREWAAGNAGHPLLAACRAAGFDECHRMGSEAWMRLEEVHGAAAPAAAATAPAAPGTGLPR